jgi:peroxiredoxin
MVAVHSTMLPLGTECPDFRLPDVDGSKVSPRDFPDAKVLVVMFLCNHCPFVKHLRDELARFGRDMQPRGVAVLAVSANDVSAHPDDAPEKMKAEAEDAGYVFPYLYDETQEVAQTFRAACTPDFYVFDGDRRLVYRGQFDDSRPGNDEPVTGADLRAAVDAVLEGRAPPAEQAPSVGCNIKWKPGNEPDYFRP